MRRWLITFLIVLLPAQFSWAAVAVYCTHESGTQSEHIGHHDHALHANDRVEAGPQLDPDGVPDSMDLDCGHCHGQCAAMLNGFDTLIGASLVAHPVAESATPWPAPAPTPPERPQWADLA